MKKIILGFVCTILLVGCSSVSPEEQAFNDSGRAKAIENETDLWPVFESPEAEFSLRYPHNVSMDKTADADFLLSVNVDAITDMEEFAPLGFGFDMAMKNKESLNLGEYGEAVDFAFSDSQVVRNLGEINAQDFLVLGRFEVCDKVLERKLYFFRNGQQIVITLSVPREKVASVIPAKFLTTDPENCGEALIWDFEKQSEFYAELVSGNGEEAVQEWFDGFDAIVDTN